MMWCVFKDGTILEELKTENSRSEENLYNCAKCKKLAGIAQFRENVNSKQNILGINTL